MLGAVTFVPEANFVGTASGVVVKRSNIYGNTVTATYTPTVLGSTDTEDTSSTGLKGQPQTGKPIFEGNSCASLSSRCTRATAALMNPDTNRALPCSTARRIETTCSSGRLTAIF